MNVLKVLFVALLVLHGLIHLMGVAKGFGFGEIPALKEPIGPGAASLWLVAAIALITTAVLVAVASPLWWTVGLGAVVVSQIAIATSWSDAKFGTIANAIVLVPLALALLDLRSASLRSRYAADRRAAEAAIDGARAAASDEGPVTEADLAHLPPPVQTYLRRVGVVGQPRVRDVWLRFRGALRSSPDADWMSVRGEQYNTFGANPVRLYFIGGQKMGLPFDGYHRYVDATATMEIRAASLFDLVDGRGAEMNESETVTVFNDMAVLAPASLAFADITWEPIDARRVRGTYRNGQQMVRAELVFDEQGDLVDFRSNDRSMSADGKTFTKLPWSTPLEDYGDFHGLRLARRGVAKWQTDAGAPPDAAARSELVYARFELEDIVVNPPHGSTRASVVADGKASRLGLPTGGRPAGADGERAAGPTTTRSRATAR
jgi:hypothetical protein